MSDSKMKYAILVGDGMGDLPLAELDGLTPLEKADIPAMDYLAAHGEMAELQTVPTGYPPGSDVANLSLMGYRPEKYYTGRAPLEAASMGVELAGDEIAYRCNLVTIDRQDDQHVRMVDYSAGHFDSEDARRLIGALNEALADDRIRFYPGVSYRHLMVLKGEVPDLATVPPHDYTNKDVTAHWQQYMASPLAAVVRRAHELLRDHPVNRKKGSRPANSIWLWGEGKPPAMPTLRERYGIEGSLISAVDLLKGIGVYAGLEIIKVEGATGYLDTNFEGKAAAALETLKSKDFVLVHVEAPDEASHHGRLDEKIQAIEAFDHRIVKPIFEGLRKRGEPFRLVVAMDHFTPISLQTHSEQAVPVAIYDSREARPGSGLAYSEANGRRGGIFFDNGEEFLNHFLKSA